MEELKRLGWKWTPFRGESEVFLRTFLFVGTLSCAGVASASDKSLSVRLADFHEDLAVLEIEGSSMAALTNSQFQVVGIAEGFEVTRLGERELRVRFAGRLPAGAYLLRIGRNGIPVAEWRAVDFQVSPVGPVVQED